MQKPYALLKNRRGSGIILAVVFSAAFSVMAAGAVALSSAGEEACRRYHEMRKAHWANESALNIAAALVIAENSIPAAQDELFLEDASSGDTVAINGRQTKVILEPAPPDSVRCHALTRMATGDTLSALALLQFNFSATPPMIGHQWSSMVRLQN